MPDLLSNETGKKIFVLGNEAIVRGAIESGISVAATYPGTPSSEIGDTLHAIAKKAGIYFEYSTNEKIAMEVAGGAAVAGVRAFAFMKHVGLNVASDAFMTLAYTGVRGGLVVVSADDPGCHSSQNEQDNRYYARLANVPMLEPSTPKEAQEFVRDGFDISERFEMPVMVRTTTRVNHARGVITLSDIMQPKKKTVFSKDPMRFVVVPAVAKMNHAKLAERMAEVAKFSETAKYNVIIDFGAPHQRANTAPDKDLGTKSGKNRDSPEHNVNKKWPLGVVTSGVSFTYVEDALRNLNIPARVLKLGMTHPMPARKCADFMKTVDSVLVVEELEPYLENELKVIANDNNLSVRILGKSTSHLSPLSEFDPDIVSNAIARAYGVEIPATEKKAECTSIPLPARPPTMCPACPHRATYYAAKKAAKNDAVFPMDIGCYTLGAQPPLKTADILLCMGSSIGTACGITRATDHQVIAFIGDSTFFHAGIPGLVNAIHNKHKFVLCILDNGTTAMTGHQPHPGIPVDGLGDSAPSLDISNLVRSLGIGFVETVDSYDIEKLTETFTRALNHPGIAVVISKHLCAIIEARNKRRAGIRKTVYEIDQTTCKKCRACIKQFGCPAFYVKDKDVFINPGLCEGCGVCTGVCKFGAIKRAP